MLLPQLSATKPCTHQRPRLTAKFLCHLSNRTFKMQSCSLLSNARPMVPACLANRQQASKSARSVLRRAEEPKETSSGQDSYSVSFSFQHPDRKSLPSLTVCVSNKHLVAQGRQQNSIPLTLRLALCSVSRHRCVAEFPTRASPSTSVTGARRSSTQLSRPSLQIPASASWAVTSAHPTLCGKSPLDWLLGRSCSC